MIQSLRRILFTILIALILPATSYAEDIIIPVNHFPPWKITEGQDKITGINIELTEILLREIGLTPTFVVRPWKRCQLMMKKGEADLMNGLLKRTEREEYMIFLDPPYKTKSTKAFYVRKGEASLINKYDDLSGLTIGTTLGSKYFQKFDSDRFLHKETVDHDLTNLKKLIARRIDTFIATTTVADYFIAQNDMENLIEKSNYVYSAPIPVYFAISKKSPLARRIPELSTALKKIVESGQVEDVISSFTR